jgi:hypothetical protein
MATGKSSQNREQKRSRAVRSNCSCGSKETVIVRLLAQRELRLKLARLTDNPEEAPILGLVIAGAIL